MAGDMSLQENEKIYIEKAIHFCVNLGKMGMQTKTMVQMANGEYSVSRSQIYKWHEKFSDELDSGKEVERWNQ